MARQTKFWFHRVFSLNLKMNNTLSKRAKSFDECKLRVRIKASQSNITPVASSWFDTNMFIHELNTAASSLALVIQIHKLKLDVPGSMLGHGNKVFIQAGMPSTTWKVPFISKSNDGPNSLAGATAAETHVCLWHQYEHINLQGEVALNWCQRVCKPRGCNFMGGGVSLVGFYVLCVATDFCTVLQLNRRVLWNGFFSIYGI